jgi:hypothetical protein
VTERGYVVGLTIEAIVTVFADAFATRDEIEALAEDAYFNGDWIPEDHYFDLEDVG